MGLFGFGTKDKDKDKARDKDKKKKSEAPEKAGKPSVEADAELRALNERRNANAKSAQQIIDALDGLSADLRSHGVKDEDIEVIASRLGELADQLNSKHADQDATELDKSLLECVEQSLPLMFKYSQDCQQPIDALRKIISARSGSTVDVKKAFVQANIFILQAKDLQWDDIIGHLQGEVDGDLQRLTQIRLDFGVARLSEIMDPDAKDEIYHLQEDIKGKQDTLDVNKKHRETNRKRINMLKDEIVRLDSMEAVLSDATIMRITMIIRDSEDTINELFEAATKGWDELEKLIARLASVRAQQREELDRRKTVYTIDSDLDAKLDSFEAKQNRRTQAQAQAQPQEQAQPQPDQPQRRTLFE